MKTVSLTLSLLWRTVLVYAILALVAMLAAAVLHGAGVDIVSPQIASSSAFIQAKPTIAFTLFAAALLITEYVFGVNLIQRLRGGNLPLTRLGWRRVTGGLVMLLLCLSALNSIVAAKLPVALWLDYRVFGTPALIVLGHFLLAHMLRSQVGTLDESGGTHDPT